MHGNGASPEIISCKVFKVLKVVKVIKDFKDFKEKDNIVEGRRMPDTRPPCTQPNAGRSVYIL